MKWITPIITTELFEVDMEHMELLGDWPWSGQAKDCPWSAQTAPWSGQSGK